jgi:ABC-type bacteriocin/lantibiotic exporter with double-glycine peptidase domain
MRDNTHFVKKTFIRQHDSSDCGVACLRSVLRFYGGDVSLERLRELSGTSTQGTTLLGLYEAASKIGFDAEGCEAEISDLKDHNQPTILHVLVDGNLQHYVLWYGYSTIHNKTYQQNEGNSAVHLVGDPARGIVELSDQELGAVWQSKKCLTLKPNVTLKQAEQQSREKKTWFINLIREDQGMLIAAALLGLMMAVLGMVMAVFSQKLVDDILPSKNYMKLFSGIGLVTFLLLIRIGMESLHAYILMRQSKDFNNRIIGYFYDNLLNLPKLFFDSRKTGDLVARMNDTARIQKVVSQLSGQVLIDILVVFVSIGFLFFYSWQVAAALLVCLPFYFFLIFSFRNPISVEQRRVMSSYALNEGNYINTLQGIRPVKSFNRQGVFSRLNRMVYGIYQDHIFDLGKIQLRLNVYASICGVIMLISILSYTSYQVLQGNLKSGELMAILGMSSSLLPSVANLALLAVPVNEARIAFERMFEFTSLDPESAVSGQDDTNFTFESLRIDNITFRFPGRKVLLNDFSLNVKKGEIIGIVGESGCGKSTLIQLIERFYSPESGALILNEEIKISFISLAVWRDHVAAVQQDVYIFNGTVLDNILLGKEIGDAEVEQFFNQEPFFSFVSTLPQGLATLIGEEGLNLSGGQKQWIGLMRAILVKPQLLLLDEATSAMDAQSENKVLDLLQELKSDMGVIYVSHRLHTLPRLCDRIYVLEKGSLAASGSHSDLMASNNLYSDFWNDLAYQE